MPKRVLAPLVGMRVRLRLLAPADLPLTLQWRNQDHIRKWFFHSQPLTPQQHQAWYDRYRDRDDDFVFVIEDLASGQPVGQIALYGIDWAARRGEYGRLMIGESSAAKKGLAREATQLLLAEALGPWGLEEVFLEVIASNQRAIAVYEACGFQTVQTSTKGLKMVRRRAA